MKKLQLIALAALSALMLAACSAVMDQDTPPAGASQKDMTSPDDAVIFGKVTAVVGNELTLDISKTPQYYLEGINPGEEEQAPDAGAETEEAPPQDQTAAGLPEIEFEYTGESRTLIIPDALDIGDMAGNEYKLTDLKEGDKLLVSLASDGITYAFILVLP